MGSTPVQHGVLNVTAVVAAFNQEKGLIGAFSVIMNLRMALFEALLCDHLGTFASCAPAAAAISVRFPIIQAAKPAGRGHVTCHMAHVSKDLQRTKSYVYYCLLLSFNTHRKQLLYYGFGFLLVSKGSFMDLC